LGCAEHDIAMPSPLEGVIIVGRHWQALPLNHQ
jgi:hypothetical protein